MVLRLVTKIGPIPDFGRLVGPFPEVAAQAMADEINPIANDSKSTIPKRTGKMRDRTEGRVVGRKSDTIEITSDARNPRDGHNYPPDVERGYPASRTEGKVRETLVNNVDRLERVAIDAVADAARRRYGR